jgi:hypothetical protein
MTKPTNLKSATPEMVDEVFTKDLQQAVEKAVRPVLNEFNETRILQGIVAGYQLTVKVTDGETKYKSMFGTLLTNEWRKAVRTFRAWRSA